MKNVARTIFASILSVVFIGISLYCPSEETAKDASSLIKEAKAYIEKGDKENAVFNLDVAFEAANAVGDYNALIEIGDLYVTIDKSLSEKAMKAWLAAGRCKTHQH